MSVRILVTILLISFSLSNAAMAATFNVQPQTGNNSPVVIVIGDFEVGDEKKFIQSVLPLDNAVVILTSNGGNLFAGIEIGKAIRLKRFSTLVPTDSVCASACAIAWLAGDKRYVDVKGQVGFHAAYTQDGGKKIPSGMANAVVGAYLSQLGYSQSAIIYATSAAPESIQWLSETDASKYGIEVEFIGAQSESKADTEFKTPISIIPLKQRQGMDLMGYDLPNMPIKDISLSQCDSKCQANPLCKAFTYNLMHPGCFLKLDVKVGLRNAVAVSGFRTEIETQITLSNIEVQSRTDFPGNDYRHEDNSSLADCVDYCDKEETCKAFTFSSLKKQCWLKTIVTSAISKRGNVSGFKVKP